MLKALSYAPFQSEIQINLGVTYELLKDADKALRQYENAGKDANNYKPPFRSTYLDFLNPHFSPEAMNFISQFNQGQLLGRENKIDLALEHYQQALRYNPISKEVKTNIELLFQQQQNQMKLFGIFLHMFLLSSSFPSTL